MPREVYAIVQQICVEYEAKFKEKVATASVVNVLLAEALIQRNRIPKDFIKNHYGCDNPIEMGFTPNARKEKPQHVIMEEQAKIKFIEKTLKGAYELWDKLSESAKASHLKTAQQYPELPISKMILQKEGIL
jgi:hypothetical protein